MIDAIILFNGPNSQIAVWKSELEETGKARISIDNRLINWYYESSLLPFEMPIVHLSPSTITQSSTHFIKLIL